MLALIRGSKDQRPVLGADGVIGGGDPRLRIAEDLGAVDEIEDGRARAELEDEPPVRAGDPLVLKAARAAHDRRDLGERRGPLRQLRRGEHRLAAAANARLRKRHHLDHALIGFARARTEGEDPVLEQDQAFDFRVHVVNFGGLLGEPETRHQVRHETEPAVIDLRADRGPVRLVGKAQHRRRVGVIHEFMRQERVQQGLDRRVRRSGVDQQRPLDANHVRVGERLARPQLLERIEPHRRQARGLDACHVPAAALDAQHIDLLAQKVAHARFHGSVAAAVKDELGLAA